MTCESSSCQEKSERTATGTIVARPLRMASHYEPRSVSDKNNQKLISKPI